MGNPSWYLSKFRKWYKMLCRNGAKPTVLKSDDASKIVRVKYNNGVTQYHIWKDEEQYFSYTNDVMKADEMFKACVASKA